VNFATEVVEAAPRERRALVELARDGRRREWNFGDVTDQVHAWAAELSRVAGRGDVVMTFVGNRPEWAFVLVACFRQGFVALPCTEQLRPADLRLRLATARPAVVVCDERNRAVLEEAGVDCPVIEVPRVWPEPEAVPPPAELGPEDPCLITFTSGTSGEPKAALHGQRYLPGQRFQAEHWAGAQAGQLAWCTAASGWSKSARNVFIAPWLRGAAALMHDDRFDPHERLELLERERVDVLCMAPTEYRVIAKRAGLRPLPGVQSLLAAGEALDPGVLGAWHEATGTWIRDGYGQTETGHLVGTPMGEPARPGSMGRPLPGVRVDVVDGQLVVDPASVPTFFLRYLGDPEGADRRDGAPWPTGDRVRRDEDGYLHFEGRLDDVIVSAGYRIGPFEVESALASHEAVAEAAVVAAPDEERGSVVRAVVVLRDGFAPSGDLARALQEHVKKRTAPYKYPRVVDFAADLPRTSSGKIRRAALRERA